MTMQDTGAEADLDLSQTPMDVIDDDDHQASEGEGEGAETGPEGQADGRQPLSPAELEQRYSNTRTALATERRERRAEAAQRERLEREVADLRAMVTGGARPSQGQGASDARIDPEEDPIGALHQMSGIIDAYQRAERQEQLSDEQRQAQEREYQQVEASMSDFETDFREDHEDYGDAAKHYAVARAKELMSFGMPQGSVEGVLREEFSKLVKAAIRAQKNPAAVVYELAKGRGYGGEKGKAKLETLAQGARRTSPLRSGGRASNGIDAATVANINIRSRKGGEDFDKAWAAMEAQAKAGERGR